MSLFDRIRDKTAEGIKKKILDSLGIDVSELANAYMKLLDSMLRLQRNIEELNTSIEKLLENLDKLREKIGGG